MYYERIKGEKLPISYFGRKEVDLLRQFTDQKNVVYKIDCECDKSYVGQTSIPFKKRLKQHMDDLKPERSGENIMHATAAHERTTGHIMHWDFPHIIASTQWKSQLDTFENIAIKKFNAYPPKGLNRDFGPQISQTIIIVDISY